MARQRATLDSIDTLYVQYKKMYSVHCKRWGVGVSQTPYPNLSTLCSMPQEFNISEKFLSASGVRCRFQSTITLHIVALTVELLQISLEVLVIDHAEDAA